MIWVYKGFVNRQREIISKLKDRVFYLEVVVDYHHLVPLPWEMVDIPEKNTKSFKQEGNVVYLEE